MNVTIEEQNRLVVPGERIALSRIRAYIMDMSYRAGLDDHTARRLRRAVDEIASNSIIYGYEQSGMNGTIEVSALLDATTLTIILEDTAPPFDPRQHQAPDDLDLPAEQRTIGGWGIAIAMRGVDHFAYEYTGQRNRHIFQIYRQTLKR
ncbi:MAG: ATP-binding protein [Chloroflexaceae bacterium]|nr:ATP-binding protein [Chloroflexaceae bacterium]